MAGKPIPTAIKKARGTLRKDRTNHKEPEFSEDKDPSPAPFLQGYAREEWDRVYTELKDKGVLKFVDRMVLAGYCEAYGEYRNAAEHLSKSKTQIFKTPNGSIQQVPYVSMKRNWMLVMLRYASELGITPSSRSRISADVDDGNKDDALLKALMGDGSPGNGKKES